MKHAQHYSAARRRCEVLRAFSMVEVVLALAIVSFVLVSLLALLPLGVKSNHVSGEESRAVNMLSAVESDLRNSSPVLNGGKSLIFGLPLPYKAGLTGIAVNDGLLVKTISGGYSIKADDAERPVTTPISRYQVTVIYTQVPGPSEMGPVHARLIVSWPSLDMTSLSSESDKISAITDPNKVAGFVETVVTFSRP